MAMVPPTVASINVDSSAPNRPTEDLYNEIVQVVRGLQTSFEINGRVIGPNDPGVYDPGLNFEDSHLSEYGNEQLVFQFEIRYCHACYTDISIRAAYSFAPDGSYLGMKTLGVCRNASGQRLVLKTDIPACPATEWMGGPRR
jgi:hypothetical protein